MSNEILNIRPVVRGGSKVILGIAGESGSGKTVTALKIARGMVSNASEIGFLDTENGRGALNADCLDAPFLIADLYPPFSPSRYVSAIKQFQNAGVKVLVIDSVTHEWEGEGGCDDIANSPKPDGTPRKVANWIGAKREHKTFMNALLQCNMHVICCIRARDKIRVVKVSGKDEFVPQGLQPVCEKNFMFEMTASFLMMNEGTQQIFLKVPGFLKTSFGDGNQYLNESTGRAIIDWVNLGEKEDEEVTKCKSEMLMECEKGVDALVMKWESLTSEMQVKMKPFMGVYKASAKAYDEQRDNGTEIPDITEVLESQDVKFVVAESDRLKHATTPDQKISILKHIEALTNV